MHFKTIGFNLLMILACSWGGLTSSFAQEQMTFFRGDACCYYIDDLFEYDGKVYTIARDHQKSVKIFELKQSDTLLHLSTHHEDKTFLLEQGRHDDFYYWVYRERLEIFYFDSARLESHEFPQALEEELRNTSGAFNMGAYGLLILPEEGDSISRFYNLSTGLMDTVKNSVSRNTYRIAVDSFIFFTNRQNNNIALLSHNLVTNELTKIYTATSGDFRFAPYGDVLYFNDDDQVHLTNGRLANTRFVFSLKEDHYRIRIERDDSTISFLTYGSGDDIYFAEYDLNEFALLDEKEIIHTGSNISSFNLTKSNDIVFLTLSNELYYFDNSNDTIIRIEDLGYRNYVLNAETLYYLKGKELFSFDLLSAMKSKLSTSLSLSDIRKLQNSGDSLFYISSRAAEGQHLISLYDRGSDTLQSLLRFGENTDGNAFIKLASFGKHLFVTDQDLIPKQILINEKFVNISAIAASSPAVEFNGGIYMLGRDKNLYELDQDSRFHLRIADLPVKNGDNTLLVKGDQLFTYKGNALIHLNVEEGSFMEITPSAPYDGLRYLQDTSSRYLIHEVEIDGQSTGLWRYDVIVDEWLKLANNIESVMSPELPDQFRISGDHLITLLRKAEGLQMRSVDLQTGEGIRLTDFNTTAMDGVAYFFASYGQELLVYYHSSDQQVSEMWRTDGTLEGTSMLDNMDDREGYIIPYQFEGKLYFTRLDSFFTTTFIYEGNGEITEVNWTPYLISQGQYRLKDRVYLLGNHRHPRQNLTLAELNGGQLLELQRSPIGLGFSANRYNGAIFNEIPALLIGDSLLVMVGEFDRSGDEMWFLNSDGIMERRTDLNVGPFDAFISDLTVHRDYLYFKGYRYGPGHQIWRIPLKDNLTSVQNNRLSQQLALYPNPAHDRLMLIDLPLEEGHIIIYDPAGREVKRALKPKGSADCSLSLGGLLNGMYFIQYRIGENYFSARFLKE